MTIIGFWVVVASRRWTPTLQARGHQRDGRLGHLRAGSRRHRGGGGAADRTPGAMNLLGEGGFLVGGNWLP